MIQLEDILKNIRENISFSKNEKRALRERLAAYAKFHPVRMEESARLLGQKSPFYDFSLLLFLRKRTMPIVLILALMFGGGGVSYAAEGAVPGDALYPIKVSVNETVRDLATLSPEAKADWAARLVERRLEEAEKITAETGALTPAAQDVIEEKIERHIERLETHLSRVEEKKNVAGAAEISAKLEITLRAHIAVLEKAQSAGGVATLAAGAPAAATEDADGAEKAFSAERVNTLVIKLGESAEKIAERREAHLSSIALEDAPNREEAAKNQKEVAEKKIAELTRTLEAEKADLSDDIKSRFDEGVAQMKEAFRKGEEALTAGAYGEAFRYFQEAGALAQKLTIFLRSAKDHGVTVSNREAFTKPLVRPAVSALLHPETGVSVLPVDGSVNDATRKDLAEAMLRKASVYLEETKQLFTEHGDKLPDDLSKRARGAVADAEDLITKGKRAYDAEDYGAAYLSGQKAVNLLSEVQQFIRKYIASSTTTVGETVVNDLTRAHDAAQGALEKAKRAISSSSAGGDVIHKAKSLYEEAHLAFSQGERAAKAGEPKSAIEFFKKTARIAEEIISLVSGGTIGIKPVPIPAPTPIPLPAPIVCTKEYAPVCASVETGIVCITTPCETVAEKTFGNACEARAAGAKVLYKGVCTVNTTTKTDTSSSAETSTEKATVTGTVEVQADTTTTKTEVLPVKEATSVTNTTEVKTEEVKTDSSRSYTY